MDNLLLCTLVFLVFMAMPTRYGLWGCMLTWTLLFAVEGAWWALGMALLMGNWARVASTNDGFRHDGGPLTD